MALTSNLVLYANDPKCQAKNGTVMEDGIYVNGENVAPNTENFPVGSEVTVFYDETDTIVDFHCIPTKKPASTSR